MTRFLATASVNGRRALLAAVTAALCACSSGPPAVPAAPPPPPMPTIPPAVPDGATPVPPPQEALPRYRCDQAIAFTVRFTQDSALVDAGPRGRELLLRDAGGVTPQQTVYSNTQLRAEFGLGSGGREAVLHYAAPPLQVRCIRD